MRALLFFLERKEGNFFPLWVSCFWNIKFVFYGRGLVDCCVILSSQVFYILLSLGSFAVTLTLSKIHIFFAHIPYSHACFGFTLLLCTYESFFGYFLYSVEGFIISHMRDSSEAWAPSYLQAFVLSIQHETLLHRYHEKSRQDWNVILLT